jgi:hypothetical protein
MSHSQPEFASGFWGCCSLSGPSQYAFESTRVGAAKDTLGVELVWEGNVPATGNHRISPGHRYRTMGKHKVTGRDWAMSGMDARVDIEFWTELYLRRSGTDTLIKSRHQKVSWDATRPENRTRLFDKDVLALDEFCFKTEQDDKLILRSYLKLPVRANDEGSLEVWITIFGLWADNPAHYRSVPVEG